MKKSILAAVLIAVMLLVTGCATETVEVPELLVPVGASLDRTTVTVGDMEDATIYSAAVAPRYTALYFTEDTAIGQIVNPVGSIVKAGDVIVSSDVSSVQRRINALDSEAAQLTSDMESAQRLHDIDVELYQISMNKAANKDERYDIETDMMLYELEFENAQASRQERLDAIASERAALEPLLAGSAIVAPTDGQVVYIGCAAGQTVGAYDVVCVVTDMNSPVIQSSFITATTIENAVEIYAIVGENRYALTAEAVDEDDYAVSVLRGGEYLSVFTTDTTEGIETGMSAVVCIVTMRREDVVKIPRNALYSEGDIYYVYMIEGDENRVRRNVEIGALSSTEAEIVSGLEEGDVIYVGD